MADKSLSTMWLAEWAHAVGCAGTKVSGPKRFLAEPARADHSRRIRKQDPVEGVRACTCFADFIYGPTEETWPLKMVIGARRRLVGSPPAAASPAGGGGAAGLPPPRLRRPRESARGRKGHGRLDSAHLGGRVCRYPGRNRGGVCIRAPGGGYTYVHAHMVYMCP